MLQNELNSAVARFTTHIIKSVLTRVVKRASSLFNSGVLQQQVARFCYRCTNRRSGARFSKVPVTLIFGSEIKYSNRNIKNKLRARVLANKLLHFVSLTDSFITLDAKLIETAIFNVNGDSLPGSLIIGTFEKRAPGSLFVSRCK